MTANNSTAPLSCDAAPTCDQAWSLARLHGWAPSPSAVKILSELKRCGGEASVANLGQILKESNGMASNPGTLAATSILRSLEKRGIVARRWVSGRGYGRTLWRLLPNVV